MPTFFVLSTENDIDIKAGLIFLKKNFDLNIIELKHSYYLKENQNSEPLIKPKSTPLSDWLLQYLR